jgi:NAD(P)H-hydrate repair Nnr-like enzyme with NAD(P)H-hydrate dehydratase domain
LKGRKDIILGKRSFICNETNGNKRCSGVGDMFSGMSAICTHWDQDLGPILASIILKRATKTAYNTYGRSLTAPFII